MPPLAGRKVYGPWRHGPLARILDTLPGKLASHWIFQGMLNMDPTERAVKLGLDLLGGVLIMYSVPGTSHCRRAATGLALAHTLNVIFNGQLMVVLKFHRRRGKSVDELRDYLLQLGRRLGTRDSVEAVWAYGSLSRGALHQGSDLDIAVLRKPGFVSGLDACLAVATERSRALLCRVPLDIYVWDSPAASRRVRPDESPVDVVRLAADYQPSFAAD